MTELERALRELESATATLASRPVEDFAEAKAAMDRRAWAIGDVARLAGGAIAGPERDDAVKRLSEALAAGEQLAQRLASMRNAAALEWSHWAPIYRALGAEPPVTSKKVDCRG